MGRVAWHGEEVTGQTVAHVRRNVRLAAAFVRNEARENVRGRVGLNVRGGTLQRSIVIESPMELTEAGAVARIGTNLRYARIHELGGVITPKTAKFLVFEVKDQPIFYAGRAKKVQERNISTGKAIGKAQYLVFTKRVNMPARPYLRPAIYDNIAHISALLNSPMPKTGEA